MCPTNNTCRCSGSDSGSVDSAHWTSETINGGSLRHVDLQTGTNGWASPPGDLFHLRSKSYLTKRQKSPAGDYLLSPVGMDWLKSATKLDNVLGRPDNRISQALRRAQSQGKSLKSFIFAVNLQVPGKEHHSAVSLLRHRVSGSVWFASWAVHRGGRWVQEPAVQAGEPDREGTVDSEDDGWESHAIANAILRLALGYVTSVSIDMGFVVEAQTEEELPERLIGAVRVCQMEMSSATVVDAPKIGFAKVNHLGADDK
ncbi:Protein ENHANCED DISEASE RESISTANCE 2, C-terminal [Sesbania bispinosa]|nr:Protein ENHANCED DISEASE RESISTANCE 2, C-terminal [Sesbania bispinosa]